MGWCWRALRSSDWRQKGNWLRIGSKVTSTRWIRSATTWNSMRCGTQGGRVGRSGTTDKVGDHLHHKVAHRSRDAGIHSQPEGTFRDGVCGGQRPRNPMRDVGVGGLAQQISAEQIARADPGLAKMPHQRVAGEGRVLAQAERETEPRGRKSVV